MSEADHDKYLRTWREGKFGSVWSLLRINVIGATSGPTSEHQVNPKRVQISAEISVMRSPEESRYLQYYYKE
jgi:hypothetical protein